MKRYFTCYLLFVEEYIIKKLFVLPTLLFSALSFGVSSSALAGYNEGYNNPVENSIHTTTDEVKFVGQGTIDTEYGVGQAGRDTRDTIEVEGTSNAVRAARQGTQDRLTESTSKK